MPNGNREVEAAWAYHNSTKHSFESVHSSHHFLDWQNKPVPFKLYPDLEPIPLPRPTQVSDMPALAALKGGTREIPARQTLNRTFLSTLLHYSAGITRHVRYPQGELAFRAASCTGALYHIDLYLVCGDLPDLPAGVYQFGVHDHALRQLRRGDFRDELDSLSGGQSGVVQSPLTMICTSTFWRNSWKYQSRTYRHCFWDSGTILANLLAITAAHSVPAHLICGFVDDRVNRLLGLDSRHEAALVLIPLGSDEQIASEMETVEPLHLRTAPLSQSEVDYPAIWEMHGASSLAGEAEVASWRGTLPPLRRSVPSGRLFPLLPLKLEAQPKDSIETIIQRRGSSRRFAREAVTVEQLSTMLDAATKETPADFQGRGHPRLNDLYLIVNAVEGLPSGAYLYRQEGPALELLKEGDFRSQAGYLGLEQALPADASADVFMLADLSRILERFGNRGYRAAQLEAAIIGGRLYLAAYAMGLGASGLTFFDDDVTEFFAPSARDGSVMFLMALGHPVRRGNP